MFLSNLGSSRGGVKAAWRRLRAWISGSDQEPHFHSWLDWPLEPRADMLRVVVRGWCYARSGAKIVAVRARVGLRVYRGTWGIERHDVATDLVGVGVHSGFQI